VALSENALVGPFAKIGRGCNLTGCVVEGEIGDRTQVWRWAHVMAGAKIGSDCMLAQGVFVSDGVMIGDGVRIQNGAAIGRHAVIEDDVYIGPNVVFANCRHPKIGGVNNLRPIVVETGASIGANAVIMGGVTIGKQAVVGAQAVVTHDVLEGATVVGCPARMKGPSMGDWTEGQV
jgi:UDP-2-acetamido-3-amino-2,3-dideoxy-glucuronate N-acetyltransferase